ncbi:hypothetical protein N6Y36_01495 [Morganella morganii]|nr:hypothetical protein N6Y36_01495 [Morganella morganii]
MLIYHSGIEDETQFTRDIQTFVMNAFNGLTEETVSVLLYPGNRLLICRLSRKQPDCPRFFCCFRQE